MIYSKYRAGDMLQSPEAEDAYIIILSIVDRPYYDVMFVNGSNISIEENVLVYNNTPSVQCSDIELLMLVL